MGLGSKFKENSNERGKNCLMEIFLLSSDVKKNTLFAYEIAKFYESGRSTYS